MLGVKQKTSKQTDKPTVVTEKGPKILSIVSGLWRIQCNTKLLPGFKV